MEHNEAYYNMTCPICGKRFHLKPYSVNRAKTHHCSKKCFYESKKESFKGENNHQYGLKGKLNPTWHGGRKKNRYGYWQVQALNHPFGRGTSSYVLEHRLVAEKYLLTDENSVEINGEKYLSEQYEVHHINGVRDDNRPENLIVMKKGDHARLHNLINEPKRKRDSRGRYLPYEKSE